MAHEDRRVLCLKCHDTCDVESLQVGIIVSENAVLWQQKDAMWTDLVSANQICCRNGP